MPLTAADIEFVTRTGEVRVGSPRSVLVKFWLVSKKTQVYLARMKLVGLNTGVFIREFLTPLRANINFRLRKAKRDNLIHKQWTFGGDNYAIINAGGPVIKVPCEADVDNIINSRAPLAPAQMVA